PRSRAADTAARSVTRTISIDRTRSSTRCDWTVIDAIFAFPLSRPSIFSIFFDADQLRPPGYHLVALHCGQRLSHCILGGGIGDQYDRHRTLAFFRAAGRRTAMPLHDRFHGNVVLREALGDGGGGAGLVHGEHANVVAALVALHRRFLADLELARGAAERRRSHAARDIGD